MKTWLNDAVVYEIYPQSFYDTNGDGVGDLPGILEKLEYIQDCGFNVIWLNPINESTFYDAGYDVTDFYRVAPRYGTNEDYRRLCEEAHRRGMRVIFDLVAGHTSIAHPWFTESAKPTTNEYTNRYIWTDSTFDSPEGISGYGDRDGNYITNFFWCQPALNYGYAHPDPEKPWQLPVTHPDCVATKRELLNVIDFWMDLGADAFRVDMAASLIKGDTDGSYTCALWHEIRAHIEARNPEVLLIAEWGSPAEAIEAGFHCDFLLHSGNPAYTSLFRMEEGRNTFKRLYTGHSYFNRDGRGDIHTYLDRLQQDLQSIDGRGVVGMITGNHDIPRLAYRRTTDELKVALTFLFTMPGTPFVYYGDEIGMDHIEGLPSKEGAYSRTGARTPMQWDDGKNHGFSPSDTPYLPTDDRIGAPTVAAQQSDSESMLNFTKRLIRLHREQAALYADASFQVLRDGYPFAYTRSAQGKTLYVAVNPSEAAAELELPPVKTVLLSQRATVSDRLYMKGVSCIVAELA